MSKLVLHTRFNVAECKNKDKVYDRHDNVDRISYVDSTRMVNRLINEGRNLNAYRAEALRSGVFSGDLKEIAEDNGIPSAVYQQDPTIVMPMIERAQIELESRVKDAATKHSESGSIINTDSDKTNPASVSEGISGVASADKSEG